MAMHHLRCPLGREYVANDTINRPYPSVGHLVRPTQLTPDIGTNMVILDDSLRRFPIPRGFHLLADEDSVEAEHTPPDLCPVSQVECLSALLEGRASKRGTMRRSSKMRSPLKTCWESLSEIKSRSFGHLKVPKSRPEITNLCPCFIIKSR